LQDPGRPLTLDGRGDAGDVATAPAEVVEAARDPLTVCMLPLLQVHGDWTGVLRGQ